MESTKLTHQSGQMRAIASPTKPLTWVPPQKIAYFKVLCSGSYPNFTYSYDLTTCGYYDKGLTEFLQSILQTPPNPGARSMQIVPNGLDFELGYASYVIFQLDPVGNWQYRYTADGIATNDATADEYINLVHVDDHGNSIGGAGIVVNNEVQPPQYPVHIAYFSAIGGSINGTATPSIADGFNLYVYRSTTGDDVVDPDIRNTGRPGVIGKGSG